MSHKHAPLFSTALLFAVLLGATFGVWANHGAAYSAATFVREELHATEQETPGHADEQAELPVAVSRSLQATAERLQKRISNRFGMTLSVDAILPGLAYQRSMLGRQVSADFQAPDAASLGVFAGSIQEHPEWLRANVQFSGLTYSLDQDAIAASIAAWLPPTMPVPSEATLLSFHDDHGVRKAEIDGVAKAGYQIDAAQIAGIVASALQDGATTLQLPLERLPGRIVNASGMDMGELSLIATGQSNFAGSGVGRKSNVRKGLSEYLHNTVIDAGQEFSVNDVFENVPISEWEMALGIFNGGELRPVAGGGLCQVATTLYRAVLNAGFPVTKRNSHSLFVVYYEKYGVGIDATIFPGTAQDLKFRNDTGHPLLIQSYTDGDEATVNIYGTGDGRIVRLTGPYFAGNAPEDIQVKGRKMRGNEIVWTQEVRRPDGSLETNSIVSAYKAIPKSVVSKYVDAVATTTIPMHASAPITEEAAEPERDNSDLRAIVIPEGTALP